MATEEENPCFEENPRKRARQRMKIFLKNLVSCAKQCKNFTVKEASFGDKIERNHEVIIQWSAAMPKLIEQIAELQTAVDELKTEKEALTKKNYKI